MKAATEGSEVSVAPCGCELEKKPGRGRLRVDCCAEGERLLEAARATKTAWCFMDADTTVAERKEARARYRAARDANLAHREAAFAGAV